MLKITFRNLLIATLVLFLASLPYLSNVYASLTVAFVLAYLLDPVVECLDSKGWLARAWGAPITLILFFVALTLVGMGVTPKILEQGRELIERLPRVYYSVTAQLGPVSERYLGQNLFLDIDKLVANLGEPSALVKPIGGFVSNIFTTTLRFVSTALGLLIIPLLAYYLLRDHQLIHQKFLYLIPRRHHKQASDIRKRLHQVLGGFIRGQLVVSSILSVYYWLCFLTLGIELSLILGLMAGFFNVVPYLGILSVLVLTFLIAFIHGATVGTYIGLGVVFAVGMGMEGSILTPRIVGRKVGLGPLTLIVALLIGSQLLGLVGMLLAIPIAAIGKVFLDVVVERYRNSEAFKKV